LAKKLNEKILKEEEEKKTMLLNEKISTSNDLETSKISKSEEEKDIQLSQSFNDQKLNESKNVQNVLNEVYEEKVQHSLSSVTVYEKESLVNGESGNLQLSNDCSNKLNGENVDEFNGETELNVIVFLVNFNKL
jgi:hypothetical protein